MTQARFISIEGGEGAGKSTSIAFIQNHLQARGIELVVTREPGGTPLAEDIRSLLLEHHDEAVDPYTELLMMFASRRQHVKQVIEPNLQAGKWGPNGISLFAGDARPRTCQSCFGSVARRRTPRSTSMMRAGIWVARRVLQHGTFWLGRKVFMPRTRTRWHMIGARRQSTMSSPAIQLQRWPVKLVPVNVSHRSTQCPRSI